MSSHDEAVARSDVLLVGSLPFDTAEEALRTAAEGLRGHVGWLPDGEVEERKDWVGMLAALVFSKHPDLEETIAPEGLLEQPDREGERPPIEDFEGFWNFRIRPGRTIGFDDLEYGRFAIESYAVFRRLRDEGVVPQGVRFQVCLPAPHSAIDAFFEDNTQWPEVYAAYLDGIRGEIAKLLGEVPAEDLVIQWDAAWEFVDMAMGERNFFKFWPKLTAEEKFQRHAEQLDGLWQGIPDEALLGFHWCYGTWGGWPMTAMADLDLCVRMSNEAKRRIGRRLDYVHMPVVRRPDEAFFAPLANLDVGETKIFLGLVHHTDGIDDFRRRRDLAGEHLPSFGIGSVCGYGRVEPELLPEILRIHAEDATELRPAGAGAA
jgi:hypothetical protein